MLQRLGFIGLIGMMVWSGAQAAIVELERVDRTAISLNAFRKSSVDKMNHFQRLDNLVRLLNASGGQVGSCQVTVLENYYSRGYQATHQFPIPFTLNVPALHQTLVLEVARGHESYRFKLYSNRLDPSGFFSQPEDGYTVDDQFLDKGLVQGTWTGLRTGRISNLTLDFFEPNGEPPFPTYYSDTPSSHVDCSN